MPTYGQLQAESWYRREIVTPELTQFGEWVREHYGLVPDAIGNKGNNAHLNGSHRSQEWILNSRYCTNRTYTVQKGLTADQARLIAGEDITPKTTADMLAMSKRIDRATRAGELEEVVAWYGNVNGDTRVDGYDNIRNVAATSDPSHLWHLHISIDRRLLRSINVMRRIFAVLSGTNPSTIKEIDMPLDVEEDRKLNSIDSITYFALVQGDDSILVPPAGDPNHPVPRAPWIVSILKGIKAKQDAAGNVTLTTTQFGDLVTAVLQALGDAFATKVGPVVQDGVYTALESARGQAALRRAIHDQGDDNPAT